MMIPVTVTVAVTVTVTPCVADGHFTRKVLVTSSHDPF